MSGVDTIDSTLSEPRLVYNTFREYSRLSWFAKNRYAWLSVLFIALFIAGAAISNMKFSLDDEDLDNLAFTVDFGDVTPLQKRIVRATLVEIDEVFGNQYVKKEEKIIADPNAQSATAAQIAGAKNPVIAGASYPVDLTPNLNPVSVYPREARAAGIEGRVMLEIIISKEGRVLRARPVGRKVGYGVDEAAASLYKKKRYKPSMSPQGEAIPVKFIVPVVFKLE